MAPEKQTKPNGMKVKQIQKPIIGKRTTIGQAFDECFKDFRHLTKQYDKREFWDTRHRSFPSSYNPSITSTNRT